MLLPLLPVSAPGPACWPDYVAVLVAALVCKLRDLWAADCVAENHGHETEYQLQAQLELHCSLELAIEGSVAVRPLRPFVLS